MEVFAALGLYYNVRDMYVESPFVDAVIDDVFEERGIIVEKDKEKAWY